MNIIIKNKKNTNLLFDENLKQYEDQKFITELLMRTGKIGYCNKGMYIYRKNTNSISSTQSNPYYTFELTTKIFEKFIKKYTVKSRLHKYIQSLILYDYGWKLKQISFYPEHYDSKEYRKAVDRIKNILNSIDDDIIMEHPFIDKFHKFYFLTLKEKKYDVVVNENNVKLLGDNKKILFEENDMKIVFTKFEIRKKRLKLNGFVKSGFLNFMKPKLLLSINDKIEEVDLNLSNHSTYKSRVKTNNFYHFCLEIDISREKTVFFIVDLNGYKLNTTFYHLNYSLFFNYEFKEYIFSNKSISIIDNKIIIKYFNWIKKK